MSTHSSKEYQKAWKAKNPDKSYAYGRKYYLANKAKHSARSKQRRLGKFGLTEAAYERLNISQSGLCAICRQPEEIIDPRNGKPRSLAVDHDHKTGNNRELLCGSCNRALGFLKEDLLRVESMAAYIKKHNNG